jgi:type II secretory pathway component PulF
LTAGSACAPARPHFGSISAPCTRQRLDRGRQVGTFEKEELPREELLKLMGGGEELDKLGHELEEYAAEVSAHGVGNTIESQPREQ